MVGEHCERPTEKVVVELPYAVDNAKRFAIQLGVISLAAAERARSESDRSFQSVRRDMTKYGADAVQ